jgi:hypothetical protein
MKTLTSSTWIVALGLAMQSSFAAAPKTPGENIEDLTLIVTDTVDLAPTEAAAMRRIVSLSMRYSGVRVKWEWRDPTIAYVEVTAQRAFRQAPELEILIAARKPLVYPKNHLVLGLTTIGTSRASLYLAEIQFLDRSVEIGLGNLMGLVAVHEIGHMLMGRAHSPCGAMLSKWGKWDVMSMLLHRMPFSNAQSKAIREELQRRKFLLEKAYQDAMAVETPAVADSERTDSRDKQTVGSAASLPGTTESQAPVSVAKQH